MTFYSQLFLWILLSISGYAPAFLLETLSYKVHQSSEVGNPNFDDIIKKNIRFSLVFYRHKHKEMVKRKKLEINTASMQLQLPYMQTERTGKTLELSHELLNE